MHYLMGIFAAGERYRLLQKIPNSDDTELVPAVVIRHSTTTRSLWPLDGSGSLFFTTSTACIRLDIRLSLHCAKEKIHIICGREDETTAVLTPQP